MPKWVDNDQVRESVASFKKSASPTIVSYMKDAGIPPSKQIPRDSLELYRFNTIPVNLETTYRNISSIDSKVSLDDIYRLNSAGLRSDEFLVEHNGGHILFAGCSVTAGEGLLLEQTWAYKTYQKIQESNKLSGFYNVAVPGLSIIETISQIFRYITLYGNPSDIFINFPDPEREYYYLSSLDFRKVDHVGDITDPMDLVNIAQVNAVVVGAYLGLLAYCRSVGIRLYLDTWSPSAWRNGLDHNIGDPRSNFLDLDLSDRSVQISKHVKEYKKAHRNDPYSDYFYDAMDGLHFGIGVHDYYSEVAYQKYLKYH
jgi:hypothetical protein